MRLTRDVVTHALRPCQLPRLSPRLNIREGLLNFAVESMWLPASSAVGVSPLSAGPGPMVHTDSVLDENRLHSDDDAPLAQGTDALKERRTEFMPLATKAMVTASLFLGSGEVWSWSPSHTLLGGEKEECNGFCFFALEQNGVERSVCVVGWWQAHCSCCGAKRSTVQNT